MNEGDYPPTGQAANPNARADKGDLYVFIRVAPDQKFSRSGSDVLYTASIPLTTAVLGGEIMIPTLEGEVKVKVGTGTGTGDKITMPGKGMKKLTQGRRSNQNGDLRVEFKVQMPKYLSVNQRTIIEMLADEMGDKNAKRVMNLGQFKDTPPPASGPSAGSGSSGASGPSGSGAALSPGSAEEEKHKNEGFLKNLWHNLSGQHEHLHGEDGQPKASQSGAKAAGQEKEEPPKKASGSGSG